MNNVIDEVLAGSPTYKLTYNDNTTATGVKIDLETTVTTAGTPLNKALFDSIQTDLNTRLLISNKATTAEAQAGTNDVKYMTPAKVQNKLNSLITTGSCSAGTTTFLTFANYTNAKIINVTGRVSGSSGSNTSSIRIVGTNATESLSIASSNLANYEFEFKFDLNNNTFFGHYYDSSDGWTSAHGHFNGLTNLTARLYNSATISYTIQANS